MMEIGYDENFLKMEGRDAYVSSTCHSFSP